jgi:hypothetical protein
MQAKFPTEADLQSNHGQWTNPNPDADHRLLGTLRPKVEPPVRG